MRYHFFLHQGSFTNYVDQFLTYFDHPPTYRGLSWTFGALPTPCPRGHRKPDHLPPMYNMYLDLQLLLSRRGYNFQVFSDLLTNAINIHKQKILHSAVYQAVSTVSPNHSVSKSNSYNLKFCSIQFFKHCKDIKDRKLNKPLQGLNTQRFMSIKNYRLYKRAFINCIKKYLRVVSQHFVDSIGSALKKWLKKCL